MAFVNVLTHAAVAVLALAIAVWLKYCLPKRRSFGGFGTAADHATYTALETMARAAPPLRERLCAASATAAAPHLRKLLGGLALTITNEDSKMLAWDCEPEERPEADDHMYQAVKATQFVVATGRQHADGKVTCERPNCVVRSVIVCPLEVDGGIVGTLGVISKQEVKPNVIRAVAEVARYVSGQLALAELEESRSRLAHAEIRALRSQISPHFIYNALNAICYFIKTDPEEALELLVEFSEFTRYSFRAGTEFTTLAEELNNIERYLLVEKARFGDRLQVNLQIAPEVLPVVLPFLALQPLVENAVRHGLRGGSGTVSIVAENAGMDCLISVEDDGTGMDPDRLRKEIFDSHLTGTHVGLGNVHDRLRGAFGDQCGLVVETGPGMGTKVSMRVPKFSRQTRAIAPPTPSPSRSRPSVGA